MYLLPKEYIPQLIDDIARSCHGRVEECRIALLKQYLEVGEVSWEKVISSLEKSDSSNIATVIKRDIFKKRL